MRIEMVSSAMFRIYDLFDLNFTVSSDYLKRFTYPWEALSGLKNYVRELGATLDKNDYKEISPTVWVHKTATVALSAFIGSPCVICENAEIRHCAFIRGSAIIGRNCVVGNSTELKNSILFDGVQVPHYNYVGDSILGHKAHMGAGSITSNVKSDKSFVFIKNAEAKYETGLKKCGAMVGDFAEIGCNSVLNPGTIVGRNTAVYPLSCVRGIVPQNSIYKNDGKVVTKK